MRVDYERYASIGAVVAAAACPIHFHRLSSIGAFIGFRALFDLEMIFVVIAQALVVVAVIGHATAYKTSRRRMTFWIALISAVAFFCGLHWLASEQLCYFGLAGLVIASVLNLRYEQRDET
jgi:hypothetical protein